MVMICLSESFIKICSLTFLDRRIAAGMPSSRGEDWQPLLMYRNSLVHGETDQPPVTSKRAYSRKKKEFAGEVFFVNCHDKQFNTLPVQFKTLLHGQKGCVFSAGI